MKAKPFRFKQFTIAQDRCAMKIGTDGVLLGAWATLAHEPVSVLDIGAGTGLVALMIAQRSQSAFIEALEIQEAAFEQCVTNFEASPWADRLFCYHCSLQEFTAEGDEQYELIVSNPPYHTATSSSGDSARDQARQNASLPFAELLQGVQHLLSREGKFVVILPHSVATNFTELAAQYGLFPASIMEVRGNPKAEIKRSLLEFQKTKTKCNVQELVIEISRHKYTPEYIQLTRDFYLEM